MPTVTVKIPEEVFDKYNKRYNGTLRAILEDAVQTIFWHQDPKIEVEVVVPVGARLFAELIKEENDDANTR